MSVTMISCNVLTSRENHHQSLVTVLWYNKSDFWVALRSVDILTVKQYIQGNRWDEDSSSIVTQNGDDEFENVIQP